MKFKIVSFDIFQTLADVNKRIPEIWKGILKNEYTEARAAQGAKAVLSFLPSVYDAAAQSDRFITMEELYVTCARKAAEELSFEISPENVAYHLMFQHSRAPFYPEVMKWLQKLRNDRKIILSSDSGHLMVDDLISKISYDRAFISDELKCYKGDQHGRFFRFVLDATGAEPNEIIHIGDSIADILGARKANITSCWVNRNNRKWSSPVKPDYIIRDLDDLKSIL